MEDGRNGKWVEERAGQLVVADLSSELLGWINSGDVFRPPKPGGHDGLQTSALRLSRVTCRSPGKRLNSKTKRLICREIEVALGLHVKFFAVD